VRVRALRSIREDLSNLSRGRSGRVGPGALREFYVNPA
jgi:hypothetical protein